MAYLTRRLLGFKSPCTALPSKQVCSDLRASMATSCKTSQLLMKCSRRIQPFAGSRYSILITCTRPGNVSTGVTSFGAKARLSSSCNCPWVWRCYHFCHQALPFFRDDMVHIFMCCKLLDVVAAEQGSGFRHTGRLRACLNIMPSTSKGWALYIGHVPHADFGTCTAYPCTPG